jgi:hypothetical protein
VELVGFFKVCDNERDHSTIWVIMGAQREYLTIQRYAFVKAARITAVTKPLENAIG